MWNQVYRHGHGKVAQYRTSEGLALAAMRWINVIGLLLCVLAQAKGHDDDDFERQMAPCAPELYSAWNALLQADSCSSYTGNDAATCNTTISNPSDSEYCMSVSMMSDASTIECKKFTSLASQFCTSIGMERRQIVTAEGIPQVILVDRDYLDDIFLGFLAWTPETYSSERCQNLMRDFRQEHPETASLVTEEVNKLCTTKTETSDNNDTELAIGLGLGLGLPLVGGIIYVLVKRAKAPKRTESLEPFLS